MGLIILTVYSYTFVLQRSEDQDMDEPEARGEVNNEKLMVCFRKGGREVKMKGGMTKSKVY